MQNRFLVLIALALLANAETDAPIIGLLTLPLLKSYEKYTSYVQIEAVKFIEATGARVVPLKYDDDIENLKSLLSKCNGLFIPSHNEVENTIPRMNA